MVTLQDEILRDGMHHPVQCNYFLFYCVSRLCGMNLIMKYGQLLPGSGVTASNAQINRMGKCLKHQTTTSDESGSRRLLRPRRKGMCVRSFLEARTDHRR